jgi:hypothetical protein
MNRRCCPLVGPLIALFLTGVAADPAAAQNCSRSTQYILENLSDDLPHRPAVYQTLSRVCEETLEISNVKDAFVLSSGAIAVVPRNDGVAPTAKTLAEFCTRFPKETLRFIARRELSETGNIGRAVRLASSTATSCRKITQGG